MRVVRCSKGEVVRLAKVRVVRCSKGESSEV